MAPRDEDAEWERVWADAVPTRPGQEARPVLHWERKGNRAIAKAWRLHLFVARPDDGFWRVGRIFGDTMLVRAQTLRRFTTFDDAAVHAEQLARRALQKAAEAFEYAEQLAEFMKVSRG